MMYSQKNMMTADGWGDEDDAPQECWDYDTYDDGLGMDEHEVTEVPETEDEQHAEDVRAAEQEVADAVRNGNADAADDAMAALAGLTFTTTPKKRKTKWTPPPQTCLVPKGIEGVFKPTTATWKKPRKTRWAPKPDKRNPTPAEAVAKSSKTRNTDDIMRLASLRKGSIVPSQVRNPLTFSSIKKTAAPKPTAWKVGQTPYKQDRFNKAQAREKSGTRVSEREMKARERNHARSEGFAKAQSGEGARFTRICKSVLDGTPCRHGDRCRFAHRPEQLVARACNWGCHCRKKSTCNFPHTPEELAAATTKLQAQFAARLGVPAPAPITCQPCA